MQVPAGDSDVMAAAIHLLEHCFQARPSLLTMARCRD